MSITMSILRLVIFVVTIISVFGGTNAKPPSRVVGGEDGDIGEFPYMAAIYKNKKQICGGSIIGKRAILTAAHCIQGVSNDPSKDMYVATGTNIVAAGAGTTHQIKIAKIHPQYSNKSEDGWKNDIAVVIVTKDIGFDKFTQPIKLPKEDTVGKSNCVASGWGDMSYPKGIQPLNIRKAVMTTMSNAECKTYAKRFIITDTHLCAYQANGVGLCSGDSGGPLVDNDTVVGIASFVLPCAKGVPDVFTRVHSYLPFIHKCLAEA